MVIHVVECANQLRQSAAPAPVARTAAGARAFRRRARKVALRRPPSGLVPAGRAIPAVSSDRLPDVSRVDATMGRWARLATTVTVLGVLVVVTRLALTPAPPVHVESVTVTQGDTLWSIATDAQPAADPRAVIDEIRSRNAIQGDLLPLGTVLQVPTSGG